MDYYTNIPPEIRQTILRFALADADDLLHSWLKQLQTLILVNRQCLQDVRQITSTWSPTYVVKRPGRVHWPPNELSHRYCVLPVPTTVCLRLFHEADIDVFQHESATIRNVASHTCFPLLESWQQRMSQLLPPGVTTVLIDATPTPGFVREKRPMWLASMVDDHRVRCQFMDKHQYQILNLIKKVSSCNNRANIVFVGSYSVRRRHWVQGMVDHCRHFNIDLQVEAHFLRKIWTPQRSIALSQAIYRLTPEVQRLGSGHPVKPEACERMKSTTWRRSTEDLFASCSSKHEKWTSNMLTEVARFVSHAHLTTYDLSPGTAPQRKLTHHIVEDLRMWTETIGEDPHRFVRLSRTPLPKPWKSGF